MPSSPIDWKILEILHISDHTLYRSNVWYIIVPKAGENVFKLFKNQSIYEKELKVYEIFKKEWLMTPAFEWLGKIEGFHILKLENVRTEFKRKIDILKLDIEQVAQIIRKIHNIDTSLYFENSDKNKCLILGDIHASNFYEKKRKDGTIQLWIFDFSSSKLGPKEEDLANIYIDIRLNTDIMNNFLKLYWQGIDYIKLYTFAFLELWSRIKNGTELTLKEKKGHYRSMITLKERLQETNKITTQ